MHVLYRHLGYHVCIQLWAHLAWQTWTVMLKPPPPPPTSILDRTLIGVESQISTRNLGISLSFENHKWVWECTSEGINSTILWESMHPDTRTPHFFHQYCFAPPAHISKWSPVYKRTYSSWVSEQNGPHVHKYVYYLYLSRDFGLWFYQLMLARSISIYECSEHSHVKSRFCHQNTSTMRVTITSPDEEPHLHKSAFLNTPGSKQMFHIN